MTPFLLQRCHQKDPLTHIIQSFSCEKLYFYISKGEALPFNAQNRETQGRAAAEDGQGTKRKCPSYPCPARQRGHEVFSMPMQILAEAGFCNHSSSVPQPPRFHF